MIYKGTFPERPAAQGELNVVDQGDTGKGKWARSLVKGGKNSGAARLPALAMHSLGRYWTGHMPGGDKTWWRDRADEDTFWTRHDVKKTVTGYGLYLMGNMAALTLHKAPVHIPPATSDFGVPEIYFEAVDAATNRLALYCFWWDWFPDPCLCDFLVSAVHRNNATQDDPMRNTQLIGMVHPNEMVLGEEQPTILQHLSIPWDVNPGDKMLFHSQQRYGSKGNWTHWRGEMKRPMLFEVTAA